MEVQIFNNSRQSQETGPWTEIKRCWIYLSAWTNNTNIPIRYAWIFNIIGPWSFVRISVETIGESKKYEKSATLKMPFPRLLQKRPQAFTFRTTSILTISCSHMSSSLQTSMSGVSTLRLPNRHWQHQLHRIHPGLGPGPGVTKY